MIVGTGTMAVGTTIETYNADGRAKSIAFTAASGNAGTTNVRISDVGRSTNVALSAGQDTTWAFTQASGGLAATITITGTDNDTVSWAIDES